MAVFQQHNWDQTVKRPDGSIATFKPINIIYGRNYSGKTTLSRIIRALETGYLSDKFEDPYFELLFADDSKLNFPNLQHTQKFRVFNEDFVRENLHFISNPNDGVNSFAILGNDNNKIESEIAELETKLGSNEDGSSTGLYAALHQATITYERDRRQHNQARETLDRTLKKKGHYLYCASYSRG